MGVSETADHCIATLRKSRPASTFCLKGPISTVEIRLSLTLVCSYSAGRISIETVVS